MSKMAGAALFLLSMCYSLYPLLCSAEEDPGKAYRSKIVNELERNESLIFSIKCTYTAQYTLTDPANMARIKRDCALSGKPDNYLAYNVDEEFIRRMSGRYVYFRQEQRQRQDTLSINQRNMGENGDQVLASEAFDGHLVKTFSRGEGESVGSIKTIESSHWNTEDRHDPYSFLFAYQNTPYSRIIRDSPEFLERIIVKDGRTARFVRFRYLPVPNLVFECLFDENGRLIERLSFFEQGDNYKGPPTLQKHKFKDYELILTKDGNTIWFPKSAIYRYYYKASQDGELIEYTTKIFHIAHIAFNGDIPEDTFNIEFPKDAEIYEDVAGLGWITPEFSSSEHLEKALNEIVASAKKQQVGEKEGIVEMQSADGKGLDRKAKKPTTKNARVVLHDKNIWVLLVILCGSAIAATYFARNCRQR